MSNLRYHAKLHSEKDLQILGQIRAERGMIDPGMSDQSASPRTEPANLLAKFLLLNPNHMNLLQEMDFLRFLCAVNVDVGSVKKEIKNQIAILVESQNDLFEPMSIEG